MTKCKNCGLEEASELDWERFHGKDVPDNCLPDKCWGECEPDWQARAEAAEAELRKWREYTGCATPIEGFHKLDEYDSHYATLYHEVRSLFSRHQDADGNRLGWGDFGSPMPNLIKVLTAAGCTLREGQELPDKWFSDEAHKAKVVALWRDMWCRVPLMASTPSEEPSVFYQLWLEAKDKEGEP